MRWYWILAIVIGAILLGWGISFAVGRQGVKVELGKKNNAKNNNAAVNNTGTGA